MSNIKYSKLVSKANPNNSYFQNDILTKPNLPVKSLLNCYFYYSETTGEECMICADGGVKLEESVNVSVHTLGLQTSLHHPG